MFKRNSARQHNLGEGTSSQRPILLRDAFTLHPCYSSVSLKKFVVLCPSSNRQNFTMGLHSAPRISALMLVIAFGGGPMTNILLHNVRSTDPQPLTVPMAASSLVFWSACTVRVHARHRIVASSPAREYLHRGKATDPDRSSQWGYFHKCSRSLPSNKPPEIRLIERCYSVRYRIPFASVVLCSTLLIWEALSMGPTVAYKNYRTNVSSVTAVSR
jgi:hypothetical protein